ncbi:MAG: NAD(P)-dependent alcohol dehydrogenase [Opitutales bacterium]
MIQAYAKTFPEAAFEPFSFDPGPLGAHDVDIEVESCGICHSDLSMAKNEWGMTSYPLVPGHEATGRIAAKGDHVTHLEVGQRVGLGWHKGYCMTCQSCMSGDHNLCATPEQTIVGNHGGFAERVRAHAPSVIPIPEGVAPESAGPLLCGGVTVFNPLVQFDVSPTASVAVLGIGGLGHLALQFCRAWGCHVTGLTSESKQDEALKLGAHATVNSRDADALKRHAGSFDLILSTVNVSMDWEGLVFLLKPKGRLHQLGATLEPIATTVFPLLLGQRQVSSSPVGSPATLVTMLEFCARHTIAPVCEFFPMSEVNEAMAHLESGKARYRIVLTR